MMRLERRQIGEVAAERDDARGKITRASLFACSCASWPVTLLARPLHESSLPGGCIHPR